MSIVVMSIGLWLGMGILGSALCNIGRYELAVRANVTPLPERIFIRVVLSGPIGLVVGGIFLIWLGLNK